MKTILFVCIENSCRSQIAEAYANWYSNSKYKVISAGSNPSGSINPTAMKLMSELGHKMAGQYSKSVDTVAQNVDYLISMGCGDSCPILPGKTYLDWQLDDPANQKLEEVREIRNQIEQKVRLLIKEKL